MPSLRIHETQNPLLYEINTRVWLGEMPPPLTGRAPGGKGKSRGSPRGATLAQVPAGTVNEIAGLGFDLVWLMGAWQTGPVGEKLAREFVERHPKMTRGLDDFTPEDIGSSPYAVQEYKVADTLGGPKALAAFRGALVKKGIGLLLDFVPNHTARDHAWVRSHPEYYVQGTDEDQQNDPAGYFVAETSRGRRLLAHGRDPHYPCWGDTAQLNYRHPGARAALIQTLLEIAGQCDGVRCDMAMLVLEDVFNRTWGERAQLAPPSRAAEGEFWAEAIDAVRARHPNFLFLAEAYWGLEGRLQELGFDYTYDKTLYDRLLHQGAGAVHGHLCAEPDFQMRSARFLENHDEPRAAEAFPLEQHRAAALLTYTLPGMRFFHEGQLAGRRFRVPVQLRRRPKESPQAEVQQFYQSLLQELGQPALRNGTWSLLHPRPAWEGNPTCQQVLAHRWEHPSGSRVVAVNYGPEQAQCYVPLRLHGIAGRKVRLRDSFNGDVFERDGNELLNPGLYLDLAPYQTHVFALERA